MQRHMRGSLLAHNQDFHNRFTGSPDALDEAERLATIAVEKGPTVPFPHWVLAAVTLWKKKFDVVKRETEIALALNPNYALAWNTAATRKLTRVTP